MEHESNLKTETYDYNFSDIAALGKVITLMGRWWEGPRIFLTVVKNENVKNSEVL